MKKEKDMMKKILAQILVAIMLICGAAFTLSACDSDDIGQFPMQSEQPTVNDDKKDDSSGENSNDSGSTSGVWTSPVKQ